MRGSDLNGSHGKHNFSNVYPMFTIYVYQFVLYNTIFLNKVNVTNVKRYTIHDRRRNHGLSIGGIMTIYVYLSNHVGNRLIFGKHEKTFTERGNIHND